MAPPENRPATFRSSTIFITFAIGYAIFTDAFLYAAIVPVAPSSLKKQVSADKVQDWVAILLGVFGIGCFIIAVPWGWYTDRHDSRRTPFLVGLVVLLAATALLWAGPYINPGGLALQVIARLVQGFASTIVWLTGLAILVDTVGKECIGEYSGYMGIALNLGNLLGPLLGGILFDASGYHAVFGLIIGVILVDVLLRLVMKEQLISNDVTTVLTTTTSHAESPARSLEEKASLPASMTDSLNSSTHRILLTKTARAAMIKHRRPLTLRVLCSMRFMVAIWGIVVLAMVYTSFETVLPITVNKVFGWGSEGGGLIFLPIALPALLGPLVGKFTDRYGGRWVTTIAFTLIFPALVCLRFVRHNTMDQKILLCALLAIIGLCLMLMLEPLFAEITFRAAQLEALETGKGGGAGQGYYAHAYAHFTWAWALGNTIGPLFSGMVAASAGWELVMLILGILCGVSAVPMVLWVDGWFLD